MNNHDKGEILAKPATYFLKQVLQSWKGLCLTHPHPTYLDSRILAVYMNLVPRNNLASDPLKSASTLL